MSSLSERLEKLDRRIVFLVVWAAVSLPILLKLSLPIGTIPVEVKTYYETIERLQPGDIVYLPADYDPGSIAELGPMMRATLTHLFRKDCRVIVTCLWETGPGIVDDNLRSVAAEFKKEYGIDYVYLGYKPGRELVMVQIANSFSQTFPTDYNGRPIKSLALMNEVDNLRQVKLMANISAGYPGTKEWVQQVVSRFDVPTLSGCTAVSTPEYYPYYQSGQIKGLLGGLAGAAGYEKLVGVKGLAVGGMASQSLGHVAIVVLILFGNLLFLANRAKRGS